MKATLPIFLLALVLSAIVYPLWSATRGAILFGNIVQIVALLLASINLRLVTQTFSRNDDPYYGWLGLQVCMWIWVIAQSFEMTTEFSELHISYGGWPDFFWMLGYVFLIFGLIRLGLAFRKIGLPMGSTAGFILHLAILLAVFGVLFELVIMPETAQPDREPVRIWLDVAYPTLDFLLFAAGSFLFRFSWVLRGGAVARVWLLLCVGFVFMGIGDILLSNLTELLSSSYRLLDPLYLSSYFLVALAARHQYRIAHNER